MTLRTIDWVGDLAADGDGCVVLIDQTRLPHDLVRLDVRDVATMVDAISRLAVRGAPAIGVAGAFGVALAVRAHHDDQQALDAAIRSLRDARPTAVNLARMVDRVAAVAADGFDRVLAEALAVRDDELAASIAMGERGADLVTELVTSSRVRAMTICNTGGLASVERGTALAVVQTLHERGRLQEALSLETRPLLQGGRLTTWELQRMEAPFRLLVDAAAPSVLARGGADVVLVGADRIARNGDTANKVGTLGLALAARHARIPFLVVAPESTIDLDTAHGDSIEIEDRGSDEVVSLQGHRIAPLGVDTVNPAFDVTPVALITAIVTDRRVVRIDPDTPCDLSATAGPPPRR